MELSHKRARFELEKAASDSARDLEVRCHTSLTQGCTDSILRSDIGPDIDKIAGSGIGKINRSTGDPVFFFLCRSSSYVICQCAYACVSLAG